MLYRVEVIVSVPEDTEYWELENAIEDKLEEMDGVTVEEFVDMWEI